MIIRHRIGRRTSTALLAIAVATMMWPPSQASAQGIFEFLFGGSSRMSAPQPLPPQTNSYADPMRGPSPGTAEQSAGSGRSVAFCVRLCDGRYFPMQRHAAATPVQMCTALCPASRTKVFSGSEIDHAAAADGSRYAEIEKAYVYRGKVVPNCSCNGKDSFGLAPVDVGTDPTLRPGDVVATRTGFVAFTGGKSKSGVAQADFTPIDLYPGLSADIRAKFATANVAR